MGHLIENISISKKLTLGFGVVLLLSMVLAITGWFGLSNVSSHSDMVFAIQKLNKVISDTKAARENYMRTASDNDRNQLEKKIALMVSMLHKQHQTYRAQQLIKDSQNVLNYLESYQDIFKRLVPLNEAKLGAKVNIQQLLNELLEKFAEYENVIRLNAQRDNNWNKVSDIDLAIINTQKFYQQLTNWLNNSNEPNKLPANLERALTALMQQASQLQQNHSDSQLNSLQTSLSSVSLQPQ